MIRLAMFVCTVRGIHRNVRLYHVCHATLRERITSSFRIERRISCDACTKGTK
jgi:hypothetical protein